MLNFEEELKKFQPSLEVDEIEAEAISEDLTDLSDLLKDILDTLYNSFSPYSLTNSLPF